MAPRRAHRRSPAVLCAALWMAALVAAPAASAAEPAVAEAIAAALQAEVVACGAAHLDGRRLNEYYYYTAAGPLWLDDAGPTARAEKLRTALQGAEQDGLPPARYRIADIEAHWPLTTAPARACLDLLLTAAFDRYSRDLHSGRVNPVEADPSWMLRPVAFDPVAELLAVCTDAEFSTLLEALAPPHAGYRAARTALARYRRLAAVGGWSPLPPGPALAPGDVHEQVPMLRARLRFEGDLTFLTLSYGSRYDVPLAEAARRFQRRHGLRDDGIVGAHTRAALNVPAGARVAQLERVLERWRWLPRALGERYVLVNTAGFELNLVEGMRTQLGMRVIVGSAEQPTPSFAATIETVVINPYWYVPARIAHDRLLPRERRRPGYLAAHGFRMFEVVDGQWRELVPGAFDWTQVDSGMLRVRQEPGPDNSLGRLSFVPPNPFDIFLHDTPERVLFEREQRSLSEGCVRVEQPLALALQLLRADPVWTEERIQTEIDALRHQTVPLPEPVPVYLLYLPAWVDDAREVQFRDDHYRREAVLVDYYPDR